MVKTLSEYKSELLFISICFLALLLDQITKYLAVYYNPEWDLKILLVHLIKNSGAGFGILKNQTSILAAVSFIVALAIIIWYRRIPKEKAPQILTALFLGGVVGNLIDRLVRNYVVDFLDFRFWPAFNIADMAISISVIGLIIYLWKK